MLKYPCKKNNECHAVDNLNFNLLPREPFELECIGCNQTVEIDPKIVLKEKKNKTVQTSKSKKTEKKNHV